MKLNLDVQVATTSAKPLPSRASLGQWIRAACTGVRRRSVAITVRIVDKKESAALNNRYRSKKGPTNVLSFPFDAPPGTRSDLLGDVVICADEQGKLERAQWAHMVVHGIMHLRGYDHQNPKEAAVMESKETRILRHLGFANPYA
jgi:probable rRNA maturation factor